MNRWTFKDKSTIRIGRAKDNDIVIYNAVVSRHHLELWNRESGWEALCFGTNGTYINNKPLNQFFIKDGMVIRLGHSGPRLMVKLSSVMKNELPPSAKIEDSANQQTLTLNPFNYQEKTVEVEQQHEVLAEEDFSFEIEELEEEEEDNSTTKIEFLE
ncbi:MAG: FHA domain-containing protein [Lyngbya sp.]|nr:FHA domain-containing protein [Lyngbya sp.]